jgi:hypothetical protein
MAVRINFTAKLSYVFESALRNSGLWPKWASGQVPCLIKRRRCAL